MSVEIPIRLTLDLGNSALKLARWGRGAAFERVPWEADWRAALTALLEPSGPGGEERVCVVALSSVAGPERTEAVRALCDSPGRTLLVNPEPPIDVACRDRHTIGMDRLYAALGAAVCAPGAALVVDAGTALTVDAVADGPVFLGGAIAPGPELLARALARGATQLFDVEHRPDAPALGQDSAEALRAGVAVGFRGAARELVEAVAREAGLAEAPLFLTGGAAAALDDEALFGARRRLHEPRLVHRGLLTALDAAGV